MGNKLRNTIGRIINKNESNYLMKLLLWSMLINN